MSGPPKDRGAPPPPQWPLKPADTVAKDGKPDSALPGSDKGKVIHDDRGNAKWDLGLDTSRVKKLTTSQLLKQLDIADLALLDENAEASPKAVRPKPGGGFDPYEPADSRPKTPTKPGTSPTGSRVPPPLPGKPRR